MKQDPSILMIEHISNFIFLITQLNLSCGYSNKLSLSETVYLGPTTYVLIEK